MTDAPERIWAFWTPDDFDDSATITAYETVQHGGLEYVRADLLPQWQPIETAPVSVLTDQWSEVLVWNAEYLRCDVARIGNGGSAWWGDWDTCINDATHWMPRPAPPTE